MEFQKLFVSNAILDIFLMVHNAKIVDQAVLIVITLKTVLIVQILKVIQKKKQKYLFHFEKKKIMIKK